jgi:thymidylate kinase
MLIGRPYRNADTQREYDWLRQRAGDEQVLALARQLIGTAASAPLRTLLGLGITRARLWGLRRTLAPKLGGWRIHSHARRRRRQWQGFMLSLQRRLGRPIATRRRLPHDGIVIATVGIDGSGKSTLTAALRDWLRGHVDSEWIYFGSGDGPASRPRRMLNRLRAALLRRRKPTNGTPGATMQQDDAPPSRLSRIYEAVNGLFIARERMANLRRCAAAKRNGLVVVTDRYPQLAPGAMDGPRIVAAPAWVIRLERRVYARASAQQPDLLLRLRIAPDVAHDRKPELDEAALAQRATSIETYAFNRTTRVVDIDASQPPKAVLHQARVAIWEQLSP